ncbi:hypothetical protein IKB17_05995 [bacterium]|nr:hypothetical protein [bacterium]
MLSSVGQNNNVQRFSAVNALRTEANRLNKPAEKETESVISQTSDGVKSAPKSLLERVDITDIRKHAEYVGEFNISDDDIKYGLMYGRSVIAEYLC